MEEIERNLGEQPVKGIMKTHSLRITAVVEASPTQITHKLVRRACSGRRLTKHSQQLIVTAMNNATKELTEQPYKTADLFNY